MKLAVGFVLVFRRYYKRNKPAVLGENYQTKINKNSLKKTDW